MGTGIFYSVLGAVFNQGSTFAVNLIIANVLGRATFGQYAIIQSTVATLTLIASFGAPMTATKYVAEFRGAQPERAGRILTLLGLVAAALALLTAGALLLCAPWVSARLLHAPELALPLAISAGVLLLNVVNGFLIGALAGFEAYQKQSRALMASSLAYLVLCGAGTWLGGLNGAIIAVLLSAAAQTTLLGVAFHSECAHQQVRLQVSKAAQESRILLGFALPAGLSGFTSMPALWLANLFLVRSAGGFAQMALYSAAFSLMNVVLFIPTLANSVGLSLINNEKSSGNLRRYRRIYWINMAFSGGMAAAGAVVAVALGPRLLALFGKSFRQGLPVLLVLVAAMVPQILSVSMSLLVQSLGKMWLQMATINLPRDIAIPLLAFLLIPAYGALGVALAYLVGWFIACVSFMVLNWYYWEWRSPSAPVLDVG